MSDEGVKIYFLLFFIISLFILVFVHGCGIENNRESIKMLEQKIEVMNTPKEAKP